MKRAFITALAFIATVTLSALAVRAADAPVAANKPVSFFKDVMPILKKSCTGCHHPGKLKGKLDLTTYGTFKIGGEDGSPFVPGNPEKSHIIELVTGPNPDMPEKGDALTNAQIAVLAQWIRQGAVDDTPVVSDVPAAPPVYTVPPVITTLRWSPDGKTLAVSGYHEVLLVQADGSGVVARLLGAAPRIESLAFSNDGKKLAVSGGAPARYGHVQFWDTVEHKLIGAWKLSNDSLYGVSLSPDEKTIAFGGADNVVRAINIADGKQVLQFKAHSDWVFGTAFSVDGKRLVSGSRDAAMKYINFEDGQFIDDINNPLEPVLCMARHPKENMIACGGGLGTPRIYKISDNQNRTAGRNDTNLVRAFERQPGPVFAIAYSPDGKQIAVGSVGGEVRIYNAGDGKRLATLSGHEGAVFALDYAPDGKQIATGGYDGKVRIFNVADSTLVRQFTPVPIATAQK